MALTPKQARFVAEYLKDLNATQAAIRAGYSAKHADVQGPRLLGNAGISRAVDEALTRRAERVEVKLDDVLRELLRLAMVDIGEAFDEDGDLKPLKEMSPDVRRAISAIEVEDRYGKNDESWRIKKVKFWDKKASLDSLMRHLGAFRDRVEHELGEATLEQLITAAAKKPEDK